MKIKIPYIHSDGYGSFDTRGFQINEEESSDVLERLIEVLDDKGLLKPHEILYIVKNRFIEEEFMEILDED